MIIKNHPVFPEIKLIKLDTYYDDRGLFQETFRKSALSELGITNEDYFVQDNMSVSKLNTFRGMHFQIGDNAQAKFIYVANGSLMDIFTCIDPNNSRFGQTSCVRLNVGDALFLPDKFAHGFIAKEDNTILCYKVSNYFNKESERTIRFCTLPSEDESKNFYGITEEDIKFMSYPGITVSDKDKNSTSWDEIKSELLNM